MSQSSDSGIGSEPDGIGRHVAPRLVAEGVDLAHLADDAAPDHQLGGQLRRMRRDLDAHLRHQASLACLGRQHAGLVDRRRQRLLHVDVLAERHRRHRDRRVHVIRRRDVDRVEVVGLLAEELAPVLVDPHVGEQLLHRLGAGQVHVGHRHQVEGRMAREGADVRERHARGSEAGVTDLASGLGQEDAARQRHGRGAGGDGLQKRATTDNGRHTEATSKRITARPGSHCLRHSTTGQTRQLEPIAQLGADTRNSARLFRAQTGCPDSVSGSALGNSDTPLSLGGEPWTDYQCWWSPSSYSMACRCGRAPTSRDLGREAMAPSPGDAARTVRPGPASGRAGLACPEQSGRRFSSSGRCSEHRPDARGFGVAPGREPRPRLVGARWSRQNSGALAAASLGKAWRRNAAGAQFPAGGPRGRRILLDRPFWSPLD